MDGVKNCAVIVRRTEDLFEGSRLALGLAVGNLIGNLFVLDVTVDADKKLAENLEWLEELECGRYSNVSANESQRFQYLSLDEIAKKLNGMDLVIPFGQSA